MALTADVQKRHSQIEVDPVNRDYQRIVWRNSPGDSILDYRLITVTYGTESAPYAATCFLKQLAMDEVVLNDFCVDDLIFGSPTTERRRNPGCQRTGDRVVPRRKIARGSGFSIGNQSRYKSLFGA